MKTRFVILGTLLSLQALFAIHWEEMTPKIDTVNENFYNHSGSSFDAIPFESLLPNLLLKYATKPQILEIGSGPGTLAAWLVKQGYHLTCIEPSQELARKAKEKGLNVHQTTIQHFHSQDHYDSIVAISSLIHVPKVDLPFQIEKIAHLLNPQGLFFVSFIEGDTEGFEDPTNKGLLRYFAKWTEMELDDLLASHFVLLDKHRITNQKMDRTFLLRVYTLK